MRIYKNFNLFHHNTFHVSAVAENFASFSNVEDLTELLQVFANSEIVVLGGGSNILFTKNFDGLVLQNLIQGIGIVKETADEVFIKAGAGEAWHGLVLYCVDHNLGGAENLSLIPGSVGASPMQNIGAYGVEVKDFFYELEAFHLKEKYVKMFTADECAFGYRDSVFKNEYKGQFVILNVTYRLSKNPVFNVSYGMLEKQLEDMKVSQLSVRAVSDAVMAIRRSKLPDPAVLGNAGSFFKNPIVSSSLFETLKSSHPHIPNFAVDNGIKIPAAWLIEQCGFKGYREGDVGCYEKQPLVIVNYGNARGSQIYEYSQAIIEKVRNTYGIELQREVNMI